MNTQVREGISGWHALVVITASIVIMAATLFLAPQ
jgi:hypothetical protein